MENEQLISSFNGAGINAIQNATTKSDQGSGMPDKLLWSGTSSGKYTVKTGYDILNAQQMPNNTPTVDPY
jgi:hypothetical protein